jgi:hypothetical protein
MRSFDPSRVGKLECDAWVAYYRRRWLTVLRASFGLVREAFGLSVLDTIRGGWWVLRANQRWAPYPENDPDGARLFMERFYRMVARRYHEPFDPVEAARREVDWWWAHRELQHDRRAGDDGVLVYALQRLYSYVYTVAPESVETAARERAHAMLHSDRWIDEGCDPASPLIEEERAALIRSYGALLAAVRTDEATRRE